jgi:plasmid stabilization system protein ParE
VYTVDFSKRLRPDIAEAHKYITLVLENPKAANDLADAVDAAIDSLKRNPLSHPFVNDIYLAAEGYRSLKVKNYSVFYIADEETEYVKVIRFLYSKRDWAHIIRDNPLGD